MNCILSPTSGRLEAGDQVIGQNVPKMAALGCGLNSKPDVTLQYYPPD